MVVVPQHNPLVEIPGQQVVVNRKKVEDLEDPLLELYIGLTGRVGEVDSENVQLLLDAFSVSDLQQRRRADQYRIFQKQNHTTPLQPIAREQMLVLPFGVLSPLSLAMDLHILSQVRRALAAQRLEGLAVTTTAIRDRIITMFPYSNSVYGLLLVRQHISGLEPDLIYADFLPVEYI